MALMNFFSQFSKSDTKEFQKAADAHREPSFAKPDVDDATIVDVTGAGGSMRYSLGNLGSDGIIDENALIDQWRELASRPEMAYAVDEIVYEAVVQDYTKPPVDVVFNEDAEVPLKIQKKVSEEFSHILHLMNFIREGANHFRKWYVDGRQYWHIIVDPKNPTNGIAGLRLIDSKTIKKIVETERVKDNGFEVSKIKDIYYTYSSNSLSNGNTFNPSTNGNSVVKVHPDAVAYANSGLFRDKQDGSNFAISHLDKSMKTANQLRMLEDALVIYRLARAPERRIFYVDVGDLVNTKAEQYVQNLMARFKTKLTYDVTTGKINDGANNMSMLEDFWLPRREGSRGTEISTLPGGQNLGELTDVDYFKNKLYKSMNIPSTRLQSDSMFNAGRGAEITREEVKFAKFIGALRNSYSEIFIQMLKVQLALKNIIDPEEFDDIKGIIGFRWKTDLFWDQLLSNEVWQTRLALLQQTDMYIGKFFSKQWVATEVLNMTTEEYDDMKKQMDKEAKEEGEENPEDMAGDKNFIDRNNDGVPDRPVGFGSRGSVTDNMI